MRHDLVLPKIFVNLMLRTLLVRAKWANCVLRKCLNRETGLRRNTENTESVGEKAINVLYIIIGTMIHVSIPSFQTLNDKLEPHKKYHVYDLWVNGAYHASVRYSALYSLHEKLLENFGLRLDSAEFPPKKIWRRLDTNEVNKRREGLTRYFQSMLQNQDIARHPLLERHFLEFQASSFMPTVNGVKLEVFLPNGQAIHVECRSDDSTDCVLKKTGQFLGLMVDNVHKFGLFLTRDRTGGEGGNESDSVYDQTCVRWLCNFEAPFISQQLASRYLQESGVHYRLGLRRAVWDPALEELMLDDVAALRLLYLQAKADIERGVIRLSSEVRARLDALEQQQQFRQYMHVCHQQTEYGYEVFTRVRSSYPNMNEECTVKFGRHQLLFSYDDEETVCEFIVRSTRVRVWKVTQNDHNMDMTFQVEYLQDSDQFRQITLFTDRAVLFSLILQAIASEILREANTQKNAVYSFDDEMSTRVIQKLESSRNNSFISEVESECPTTDGLLDLEYPRLLTIISRQMPFDGHTFEDVSNNDL